ncbi:MAG: hypothetical protein DMF84_08510 [Acidobacteria bacterium]|nr:MAG: hypothetical protein DMF84_08510 [Acidobacteriota bacterium]
MPRLVNIGSTAPQCGLPRAYVGMANVYDWKVRDHAFDDIAALRAVGNRWNTLRASRVLKWCERQSI